MPRTDTTTRPLTGRCGRTACTTTEKERARWTTHGYEQNSERKRGYLVSDACDDALEMMLVDATLKGHVVAIGDCSGAFHQAFLKPDGTRSKAWIEPPPEAELGPDCIWEAVSAFPGLIAVSRAWVTYSAKVLTSSMEVEQSRYDGCRLYRLEPRGEHTQENVGRNIDDFLVTGPGPNVERFLEQAN